MRVPCLASCTAICRTGVHENRTPHNGAKSLFCRVLRFCHEADGRFRIARKLPLAMVTFRQQVDQLAGPYTAGLVPAAGNGEGS
jgi:hypothetical protein